MTEPTKVKEPTQTQEPANTKKLILLQTVGTGSLPTSYNPSGNPVWEALAFVVNEYKPNLLIQLCSQKTKDDTVPKFDDDIKEKYADINYQREIIVCEDHDDIDKLVAEYSAKITELKAKHPDAQLMVDFTSGTKAMSAALAVAATGHRIATFTYATGPRDKGGRVTHTTAAAPITPTRIFAQEDLRDLGQLFDQGQFVAVKTQAKKIAKQLDGNKEYVAKFKALARIARFYDLWDTFKWDIASKEFRAGKDFLSQSGYEQWPIEKLRKQIEFTQQAEKIESILGIKVVSTNKLIDLFANAKRKIESGYFDDALSRFYRLTELILQCRFQFHFNTPTPLNPTKDVSYEKLQEKVPNTLKKVASNSRNDTSQFFSLGLKQVATCLNELNDPIGKILYDSYQKMDADNSLSKKEKKELDNSPPKNIASLINSRNNSYLAHGNTPAKEPAIRKLEESLEIILKEYLKAIDSQASLEDLLEIATFCQCPWTRPTRFSARRD